MIKVKPITVKRSGIWLNLYTPTIVVAIIHKPANDAYVMPTGIVFITIDNVNIQPTIVMSVIPFGIVGAILGHILMGANISIMSMCGIVALSGVVVNDSLVLVDYVNRHRIKGSSVIEAAWEAGASRFRPIVLTSLTTFAGLSPMLFETDLQAKFLIPMAISLGFGILFATAITLFLCWLLFQEMFM